MEVKPLQDLDNGALLAVIRDALETLYLNTSIPEDELLAKTGIAAVDVLEERLGGGIE